MKLMYLMLSTAIISLQVAKAQEVTPTDLFQIYKDWQIGGSQPTKYAYDYIGTMDSHWSLRTQPQRDDHSESFFFGYYYGDQKWDKDGECNIMLSLDQRIAKPKTVTYLFADTTIWEKYNRQMQVMSAVRLDERPFNGGHSTAYQVNDIAILLIDFPPGINGVDRTFEVELTQF